MRKVFLLILDGYGNGKLTNTNAVHMANTPFLDSMTTRWTSTELQASGTAVGLPAGLMGNSEVGHLNLGAGRIVFQTISRIDKAIADGSFFYNSAIVNSIEYAKKTGRPLHLLGLISDGGVHSSMNHVKAILDSAKRNNCKDVFLHVFTDGRDTPPQSGLKFVLSIEKYMAEIGLGRIATISGRYWAMDRDKRWDRVQKAYNALVNGEGDPFDTAEKAIMAAYQNNTTDEFIPPSIISSDGKSNQISMGDAVLFFNFRADRARELTLALTDHNFSEFSTAKLDLHYTTMAKYHADYEFPTAFKPVKLVNLLGEEIARNGLKQFRIAETEKYAHITFFFNGGVEQPLPNESRSLVQSPKVATYDLQPEMSANEVADRALNALEMDYSFILLNFANPDMIGHTGSLPAVVKALEALDPLVESIVKKAHTREFDLFITADHGNCEVMVDEDGQPHTAHTTNLVPFVYAPFDDNGRQLRAGGVLADVAPTILELLNILKPSEMNGLSLFMDTKAL
jgi:2,3-bisphosphoglycerate-independent phosphoglycerate mutase